MDLNSINTTALAFMGDSVYETYVRKRVLLKGEIHPDVLNKEKVSYVNAKAQAKCLKELMNGFLTDDEISLCKRARNHKVRSMAKNQSPIDYKNATAFEALIGYTYLKNDINRLEEIVEKSFLILEEKNE